MTKSATGDQTFHLESVAAGTVLYRNGREVMDSEEVKGKKPKKEVGSLITRERSGPSSRWLSAMPPVSPEQFTGAAGSRA